MPGEDSGTPESKSYTAEELTALLAEATETGKKSGQQESWSHFQGVADKEINRVRTEEGAKNKTLEESVVSMRKAHLESLPESERDSAMIREMYEERGKPAPAALVSDKPDVQGAPEGSYTEEALQTSINKSLTDLGLDVSKVDWGKGQNAADSMNTFLKSVVEQVKGSQSSGSDDKSGEGDDGDNKGDAKGDSESQKHIDTSRGAGDTNDFFSKDPQSIIASEPWQPMHRGMSG